MKVKRQKRTITQQVTAPFGRRMGRMPKRNLDSKLSHMMQNCCHIQQISMGKARDGDSLSLILVLLMMAEVGGELQ